MLLKIKDSNINFAYNLSYSFHDVRTKTNLIIKNSLEETLNETLNKQSIAKNLVKAEYNNGNFLFIPIETLKKKYIDEFSNLVSVYNNLYLTPLSSIEYGDMLISYTNQLFSVSGVSPLENIRNLVYNVISVSILEDYKKRN